MLTESNEICHAMQHFYHMKKGPFVCPKTRHRYKNDKDAAVITVAPLKEEISISNFLNSATAENKQAYA